MSTFKTNGNGNGSTHATLSSDIGHKIEEEAEKLRANELVKQFKVEMGLLSPETSSAPAEKTIGGKEAQKTS